MTAPTVSSTERRHPLAPNGRTRRGTWSATWGETLTRPRPPWEQEGLLGSDPKDSCGCSSVVEHQLPKLNMRVRFPSSAPRQRPRPEGVPLGAGPSCCLPPHACGPLTGQSAGRTEDAGHPVVVVIGPVPPRSTVRGRGDGRSRIHFSAYAPSGTAERWGRSSPRGSSAPRPG